MPNQEHLQLLMQGVDIWNTWRWEHRGVQPHLNGAALSHMMLSGIDLSHANLSNANLSGANLSQAQLGWTMLGDHDLRSVQGLETIEHLGPSSLSINTLTRSQGQLPETFLHGTGATDSFLEIIHLLASRVFEAPLRSEEPSPEKTADESERRYWSDPMHYVADPTFSDIEREIEEEIALVLLEKKRAGRVREDARGDARFQAYVYAQNHRVEVSEDWIRETVARTIHDIYTS